MAHQRNKKTVIEFFAGIGLVHEALRRTSWRCIYANDLDPKKRQMHEGHYGRSRYYHECDIWDAEAVLSRLTEDAFLATASFPCTDMSLAGKMRGFKGEQSSSFFGFIEILRRLDQDAPKIVLLENVPGFLHSRQGEDFQAATSQLAKLNYHLDSFILDARDFVAQSRPRLFIVGYHQDILGPPIIERQSHSDAFEDDWLHAIKRAEKLRPRRLLDAIESSSLSTGWVTLNTGNPPRTKYSLLDYIDTDAMQDWWCESEVQRHLNMMFDRHRSKIDALVAGSKQCVALTAFRRVRDGQQRTEVRFDGVAGCLRTPRGGSAKQIVIVIENSQLRMRWMSPREYARLQGVEHYRLPKNVIQGLFGFGDAVCVPVIQWIDTHMITPVFEASATPVSRKPMRKARTA